jgi:hypothetical protein
VISLLVVFNGCLIVTVGHRSLVNVRGPWHLWQMSASGNCQIAQSERGRLFLLIMTHGGSRIPACSAGGGGSNAMTPGVTASSRCGGIQLYHVQCLCGVLFFFFFFFNYIFQWRGSISPSTWRPEGSNCPLRRCTCRSCSWFVSLSWCPRPK